MSTAARWWLRLACVLAAVVGLKYGYAFGERISGPWIGALLALNCAVLGAMLVQGLAGRLWHWWAGLRARRG